MGWNTSKIISPPNSDKIACNVEILAQSSADFALTYNFQGTHILGASRGHLCDSVHALLVKIQNPLIMHPLMIQSSNFNISAEKLVT